MPVEYINVYTFVTGNSQKKMSNDYYFLKAEQNGILPVFVLSLLMFSLSLSLVVFSLLREARKEMHHKLATAYLH